MTRFLTLICFGLLLACQTHKNAGLSRDQANEIPSITGMIPVYKCESVHLEEMVRIIRDSSAARYDCEDLKRLTLTYIKLDDGVNVLRVDPDYYYYNAIYKHQGQLDSLDAVLVKIDSTDVFTKSSIVKRLESIGRFEYVGNKEYELKYEDFDFCLNRKGINFLIDFNYDPYMKSVSIFNYGEYLPRQQ
ncbi:hypothetical protein N9O59_05305 [Schleiferiaceae bacterium]|jgi:hypothetical protein|nr:hypothetical protein [Schleiferiaceae bacterium]MDA9286795.1 hypothetical protein [Schleiferiaceae bacterium]MDA9791839.1 hypothetical protein [Schleiferiaceae bacterium]MDB4124142.1 hypothetical protein [Schleiferiaceae bacterium]MDB4177480.1 hypothetical protein [Schleiferiaceae bacterium]|tara:strand:+ start:895 stop:1461 length:567 start_codon:yes stop_codon:yes gene_type:complete